MNLPLPDFLRAYGELHGPEGRRIFLVFVGLVVLVTLVMAWYAMGALIQVFGRWSKRRRKPPEPRSPSTRPPPEKKSDTDG